MKIIKIIFLFLFLEVSTLFAQEKPFSNIEAIIQINQNINQTDFHQYWKSIPGFTLYYETPFYIGDLIIGGNFMHYHSKFKKKPDFQSYFIFLGWLYNFSISNHIEISPGIKFGNYLMNFDISEEYEKYESEICLEYFGKTSFQLSQRIKFNLEIGKESVYTYKILNFTIIKAGISLKIDQPDWFEDFVK